MHEMHPTIKHQTLTKYSHRQLELLHMDLMGNPMLQGHARCGKSGLGAEQLWNAHEFTSFEAKELREQVTNGREIYLARG